MQKSDIEKIIDHLKLIVPYESIHIENINPQSAVFDECKKHINPVFYNYFESKNIIDLYVHQVEVINEIFKKKNVIIVSKTASGKTLCFNIPVVNQILSDISATALYLFPTKALAQDQYKTLSEMLLVTNQNIVCNIYDGDTPKDNRIKIRNQSNIILSNPDMLHYAILPYHTHWHRFFKNIKFLVLDEVHAYRGIFGSHVGLLIRRFMRICKHYGSVPQIICASATIANAKSHAEKLTDSPFTLVEKDGAPRGKKQFLIWNPPIISMGNRKIRKASQEIGIQILGILLEKRLKTICFARSRSSVEVISSTLKQIYDTDKDRIAAYRGGYLPLERREIERNLFEGQTDIVISTNALELGIDIGALDVCLILGYPGSVASLWQQAGRSGRSSRESLIIFIPNEQPIDLYFSRHPNILFGASPENAIINTKNLYLLTQHLQCALYELPLSVQDRPLFGSAMYSILQVLVEEKIARVSTNSPVEFENSNWNASGKLKYPAGDVNLRCIGEIFTIIDMVNHQVIGTTDKPGLYATLYIEAIYIHQSNTYQSIEIDFDSNKVHVKPLHADYYTLPFCHINIPGLTDIVESKNWRKLTVQFGDINAIKHYNRFARLKFITKEILGYGDIDLPPLILNTEAIRIAIPRELVNKDNLYDETFLYWALLGVANLFTTMMTIAVMCDFNDIGFAVQNNDEIYIYDQIENGGGFSEKGYEIIEEVMQSAFQLLENCPCKNGCPACILPHAKSCLKLHDYDYSKEAAKYIFHLLLEKVPYIPVFENKKEDSNTIERQDLLITPREEKKIKRGLIKS